MPLVCDAICDACGTKQCFASDVLALHLDDETLAYLPHPGESWSCEKHGLRLQHASERGRLFRLNFSVCRHCGEETHTTTRLTWTFRDFDDPTPWFLVKASVAIACVLAPIAWWAGRRDGLTILGLWVAVSPFVDWWERRKTRLAREREGKPELPTADAPGLTTVPAPRSSPPCCDRPDLVTSAQFKDADRIPCRACRRGVLRIESPGIA